MGRKSKVESRKKEILQTYLAIISTQGLDGITVSNIAEKMKVNPSLIIHYFKTKEAIENAFIKETLEKFNEEVPCKSVEQYDPKTRFQNCLQWVSTPMKESNILISLFELSNNNKIVKPLLKELFQKYETYICREVDHAISHRLINEKVRDTAVWILVATLHHVRNTTFLSDEKPSLDISKGIYDLLQNH